MRNRAKYFCAGIAFATAIILLLSAPAIRAETVRKVIVLPFSVHSKTNAAFLQEELHKGLSSELRKAKSVRLIDQSVVAPLIEGKVVNETLALSIGREAGVDYAVVGSLTELGGQISADAVIIDISQGRSLPAVYVQGKGIEKIGQLSSRLAENILLKISSELRIAKIEFKGNRKIESNAINQVLKSSAGNVFSEADLSADIKAIYRMGYFDDVAADILDTPEGKIITFIVQEKPLITVIKIKGNKAISKDDIESVLTAKPRQSLNLDKVKGDIEKIKALYDNKGYFNADITYEVKKEGEKDVHLVFAIKENEKLYIRQITFEGNQAYSSKELKNMMKTSEKGFFSFVTDSGLLKKDDLKQDVAKLNAFYLNNGFINAQVGEPEITHDQKGIKVHIPLSEGKQFRVGIVEIAGDELKTGREALLQKLQIRKKEFYERGAVAKDMDYLTQAASDEGYAYADVSQRLSPHEKEQKVDVTYLISKGKQVYFNRISITGNTKTRDKVIRRQLAVVEGDLYNSSNLKKSYMDLNRLRYFEEINFQTEKGTDETLTDVNIHVKEKPTGVFSVGAGYSAVDQAVFVAQVSQQNLLGRGQTLSLRAHLGAKTTNYELSFVEPWLFDIPLWSKIDLWNTVREYDEYDLSTNGFGVTLGYPIWERITGYISYKLSTNDVSNIAEGVSSYIKEQEGTTTTSSLTPSLTRDTTDDFFFPTQGSKNSLSVEYAGGFLGGNAEFIKYILSSAWFFPLPLETVFAIRGRAGYLQQTTDKEVPVYERFILGGINSLRGLRQVGPTDPETGDVIGGFTMLNFNVEFLFPLIKEAGMKGVVFYDTGNAWDSGYDIGDMRHTAGIGVRWYSPIGPLRLEWGYVLDRKADDKPSRWEFTIGVFM